jgi:glycosyltransferase involved in cell wall biosynthesis
MHNQEGICPDPNGCRGAADHQTVWASKQLVVVHISEAPLGGVLMHLRDVVAGQGDSAEIAEVHVLVPESYAPELSRTGKSCVKLRLFPCKRGSVISLIRLALETARIVRRVKPDIVHLHATLAGLIGRLCMFGLSQPPLIVYCPHGWPLVSARKWWPFLRRLERRLASATDSVICVSESDRRIAIQIGIPPSKCCVIRNGISELEERQEAIARPDTSDGRLKMLFVGRFDEQKGFDTFLDVMRRLRDIADGLAAGSYIVETAKRSEAPSNVKIVGWCSSEQLHDLYEQADLVLMPSRSEGLPLVALEAMRAKRAVFASRAGGLSEVVVDRVTGRLLDFTDCDKVVRAIRETSVETLRQYGEQGFARFRNEFAASKMNAALLRHYQDLVMGGSSPLSQTSGSIVTATVAPNGAEC